VLESFCDWVVQQQQQQHPNFSNNGGGKGSSSKAATQCWPPWGGVEALRDTAAVAQL
jgi:hypothetical protein